MNELDETIRANLSFFALFKKLWPFLRVQPRRLAVATGLVLLYVTIGRSLPILFGYAIDHGFKQNNLKLIYQIAGAYLILDLSRGLLSFLQNSAILKMGNLVLYDIREKLILHVQRLPMTYFDKTAAGRTVTRVTTDIANLGELFTDGFAAFFISIVEIVSTVVALATISWRLTILSLLTVPLLLLLTMQISNRIRHRFGEAKKRLSALNASAAETISGLRVVHLFDRKNLRKERFSSLSAEYKTLQLQTVKMFAALWPVVEAFNIGTVAGALLFGGFFHQRLGLSIGELSAFVLLVQSFFHPLKVILEKYNQLQNSLTSADRIFDILQEDIENVGDTNVAPAKLNGAIEYKNITFKYSADAMPALRDVSLKIKAGERVAFVGKTGSGKTTMVSLLQKFYPLQEGDILVDDRSIRDFSTYELRSRFGVVLQDTFLFRGNLLENVTLHREDIVQDRVLKALADVGLHYLLERDGKGLEFFIEERGANLSFGERQLVAFARLLAFNPDVLILDEATSNIDSLSEEKIQRAIAEVTQGRTSLIIAHRLSTIMNCDKIVVMENGHICEMGTHAQLLNLRGKYSELYLKEPKSAASPTTIQICSPH